MEEERVPLERADDARAAAGPAPCPAASAGRRIGRPDTEQGLEGAVLEGGES